MGLRPPAPSFPPERPIVSPPRLVVPLLAGIALTGCRSAEHELVDRFLEASAREDNQTVALLSMLAFPEPLADWEVLEIGPARSKPYAVPELRALVEAAEDERDIQFREFGNFRQENYDDLARIQERLRDDPDYRFTGRLGELQARWDAFREDRRDVVAELRDAELALEREIRRVNKSLQRESSPEYLDGETLEKIARVRIVTEEGDDEIYLVTLSRYELRNQFDAVVPSRWIVTDVEPAGELSRAPSASRTVPRAASAPQS